MTSYFVQVFKTTSRFSQPFAGRKGWVDTSEIVAKDEPAALIEFEAYVIKCSCPDNKRSQSRAFTAFIATRPQWRLVKRTVSEEVIKSS